MPGIQFIQRAPREQQPLDVKAFHEWQFPRDVTWAYFHRIGPTYLVRFPDWADFEISHDGREVTCWPAPGVSDATLLNLFLNQVTPLARSRAGWLMFHASAVAVDDFAMAFMGESGRGKSTLAASFATSGHSFLTDDGLAVHIANGHGWVSPSTASLRLWPDSEEALIEPDQGRSPPIEYSQKSRFLADDKLAFCDEPRRLRRIFLLGNDEVDAPRIDPMNPSEALIELVRHSFLLDIDQGGALAGHFDQLTSLVKQPVFYRLNYPRRFGDLPALRALLIGHAKGQRAQ